jgi:hypothetical protein
LVFFANCACVCSVCLCICGETTLVYNR